MPFKTKLDTALAHYNKSLWEGSLIRVNKLISDAIRIPEGEYRILMPDCERCVLVSTNEASKQTFEVTRPTLAGFYNPEVHRKVVTPRTGNVLAERIMA